MVVLTLVCQSCGNKQEVLSCNGIPRCEMCGGKLKPYGPLRPATPDEEELGASQGEPIERT